MVHDPIGKAFIKCGITRRNSRKAIHVTIVEAKQGCYQNSVMNFQIRSARFLCTKNRGIGDIFTAFLNLSRNGEQGFHLFTD